jgi:hypothetical protein
MFFHPEPGFGFGFGGMILELAQQSLEKSMPEKCETTTPMGSGVSANLFFSLISKREKTKRFSEPFVRCLRENSRDYERHRYPRLSTMTVLDPTQDTRKPR